MSLPVLWHFTFSHFNEKARWALDYKGVRHVRRALVPGFHERTVKRMTGQTAVPVLEIDGRIVFDSTRIIEALEQAYPEPPLYPSDPAERRRALDLEDFFDEELGPHIRRVGFSQLVQYPDIVAAMFTAESGLGARLAFRAAFPLFRSVLKKKMMLDEATVELSRKKTMAAFDRIEREVRPSGYLVGDRFSVADLTAAALFSPLVSPPEFPYRRPGPAPEPLARARDSVASRPAFRWVEEMYRRHRGRSTAVDAKTAA